MCYTISRVDGGIVLRATACEDDSEKFYTISQLGKQVSSDICP